MAKAIGVIGVNISLGNLFICLLSLPKHLLHLLHITAHIVSVSKSIHVYQRWIGHMSNLGAKSVRFESVTQI